MGKGRLKPNRWEYLEGLLSRRGNVMRKCLEVGLVWAEVEHDRCVTVNRTGTALAISFKFIP